MSKSIGYFLICCLWIGCASSLPADYSRVLEATHKVMTRHNLYVQESQYRENTLVAVSQVRGDFLNKTRVKVVARVVESDEGYPEPSIRVLNQWDNADTKAYHDQVGERWVNLSTNAAMEAQLYNEIQRELGVSNAYEGKAWQPPQSQRGQKEYSVGAVPLMPYEEE